MSLNFDSILDVFAHLGPYLGIHLALRSAVFHIHLRKVGWLGDRVHPDVGGAGFCMLRCVFP